MKTHIQKLISILPTAFGFSFCLLLLFASGQGNAQTTTFNYTGSMQSYIVPGTVTQVTVTASGAQGGDGGFGYVGANGATVQRSAAHSM